MASSLFQLVLSIVLLFNLYPVTATDGSHSLSQTVSHYLDNGGHQLYKQIFNLPDHSYYNPHHFFTRDEAHIRVNGQIVKQSSKSQASDLKILRMMGLHVPGIDSNSDLITSEKQSNQACQNGMFPPTLVQGDKSDIAITYTAGTPTAVQHPVEFSIKKWADEFESKVRIRICFTWRIIDGKTLGATTPPYFTKGRGTRGGHKKLKLDVLYNPALASALEDEDMIPPDRYHIHMVLNSAITWHLDTSRRAPTGKYDLATTVMHELTHGLFFSGTLRVPGGTQATYSHSLPGRFDQFMVVDRSIGVVRSCTRGDDLYSAVTSNNLKFSDPKAGAVFGLYAPRQFETGSSMYHFNDTRSLEANCDALGIDRDDCSDLMTHQLVYAYTRRTLGETTLRIYRSMRGNSAGPTGRKQCLVPTYPNRQGSGFGVDSQSDVDIVQKFVLPTWGIITVAVIGGIGVLMVFGVVVNAIIGRR